MSRKKLDSAFVNLFGGAVGAKLLATLADNREEWLTATELCRLAGIAKSGFHRDHRPMLLDYGLVERRDDFQNPRYRLADTEQAELVARFHEQLRAEREEVETHLNDHVHEFFE